MRARAVSAACALSPSETTEPWFTAAPAAAVTFATGVPLVRASDCRLPSAAASCSFEAGRTRPPSLASIAWEATAIRVTPALPASVSTAASGTLARVSPFDVARTRPPTEPTAAATAFASPDTSTAVRPDLSVLTPVATVPTPLATARPLRCVISARSRESTFFWVALSPRLAWARASIWVIVFADSPPVAAAVGGAAVAGSASPRLVAATAANTSGRNGRIRIGPP